MNTAELHEMQLQEQHCLEIIQKCQDVINNLQGYTPDGFKFTFSIFDTPVVTIDIMEDEGDMVMGVFLKYRDHYVKKHKELGRAISNHC